MPQGREGTARVHAFCSCVLEARRNHGYRYRGSLCFGRWVHCRPRWFPRRPHAMAVRWRSRQSMRRPLSSHDAQQGRLRCARRPHRPDLSLDSLPADPEAHRTKRLLPCPDVSIVRREQRTVEVEEEPANHSCPPLRSHVRSHARVRTDEMNRLHRVGFDDAMGMNRRGSLSCIVTKQRTCRSRRGPSRANYDFSVPMSPQVWRFRGAPNACLSCRRRLSPHEFARTPTVRSTSRSGTAFAKARAPPVGHSKRK